MITKADKMDPIANEKAISKQDYKETLHKLQVELVKLQRHFIECNDKILIILEGRDASGKDGTIKRIVKYLSPRETRVVALGKPSDRDRTSWYFQRYVPHLPAAQELVLFNRSWYNRAGVERVMGFCTKEEHEEFMGTVPHFENMLIRSGVKLFTLPSPNKNGGSGIGERTRSNSGRSARSMLRQSSSGTPIAQRAMRCWHVRTRRLRLGLLFMPMISILRASISSKIFSAGFIMPARINALFGRIPRSYSNLMHRKLKIIS